ncbi:Uncharacterized conserved protein, DUF1330 family [Filimonas lacunae]|uniref:Uncharacterized conserved protein, DUF1330 family n=1 Tax=Filimonas lacunae TaxID=477680 RepID=A0A173MBK6_9BACT|nr:DUF1330 domain-containing protein [Filimonas lacunae]BAV04917.1 hypothetical protein FLA_0917 [Filimonas lacunae]SIT33804.1 Uncharacterized conserved protein, DUF1330 family [Filimonas lacunae]
MSAYLIFILEQATDTEELSIYTEMVPRTLIGYNIKILTEARGHSVLEGPSILGGMILEFPSLEAAQEWYNSAEYQAAALHRFKGANTTVLLMEGIPGITNEAYVHL